MDPSRRPTACEILEYWIPLIFRNLGKNKGYLMFELKKRKNDLINKMFLFRYSYEDDISSTTNSTSSSKVISLQEEPIASNSSRRSTVVDLATAQTETKEIMKAETAQPDETIEKRFLKFSFCYTFFNVSYHYRSVLYQLKSFGNTFSMNPIQLPPKACILCVATSETHFVVVNSGKN